MKIIASVVLIGVLALGTSTAAPRGRSASGNQLRPLTFANVVAFFREALGRAPLKTDARIAIFAEGEWKNRDIYNHSLIFIENADEDVEITFVMSGDEGMNWVNEFFDSPFFQRGDTEALFVLLNSGPGTHKANVGRFRVELDRWTPRHHEIVVLSFQPRHR